MKQNIWLIAFALCAFFACDVTTEAPTTATVKGTINNPGEIETVQILSVPAVGDRETVAEAEVAEDGTFEMTFDTEVPKDMTLRIGKETSGMYIHPGDALTISVDTEEFDETMTYEGQGAVVNNYLASKYLKREQYQEELEETNIYKLDLEDFLAAQNGLYEILKTHLKESMKDQEVSEEFMQFEKTELRADWANTLERYPDYHPHYTGKEDFEVEESYYAFREKIDLTNAAGLASPAYRSYLGGYTGRKMNGMIEAGDAPEDDWPGAYRAVYATIDDDANLGEDVKAYIKASQLHDYISYFGTDGAEEMMAGFKAQENVESYTAVLEDVYAKWEKVAKGQPAPDFTYASIEGEDVSFSDFMGKVVYLDVWATWCGPCKGEIPHSKTLKAKYADNPNVVFMYVSVDDNKEAWEKFLADDPEFKGVHLITGTGWESELTDAYMIKGIPRYILVDGQGKIVSASAPRPSSGEQIENMINEALESADISG